VPARRSLYPVCVAVILVALCRGELHAQDDPAATRQFDLSALVVVTPHPGLRPLAWRHLPIIDERLHVAAPPLELQTAAQAAPGAARDRSWELEVHGGWLFNDRRRSGSGGLPSTGAVVGGQISVTSFFFGNGSRLFNDNQAAIPGGLPSIVPLDPLLLGSSLRWQRNIGTVGLRISRRIARRFTVEFSGDYDRTALALPHSTPDSIDVTRASIEQAIGSAVSGLGAPATVSTSATVNQRLRGTQLSATGALLIHLRETTRLTPYVAVGGGAIFNRTDTPSVTVTSRYELGAAAEIVGTDSVRLHYTIKDRQYIGLVGAGVKYRLSPRWGLRVDARARLYPNRITNFVDATPDVVLRSTGSPFPRVDLQALQFSSTAPLTGAPIANAATFATSGLRTQVGMAAGLILRF
jgi:hypothetical protein